MATKLSRAFIAVFTVLIFLVANASTSIRYEMSSQPRANYSLANAIDHVEALPEFADETSGVEAIENFLVNLLSDANANLFNDNNIDKFGRETTDGLELPDDFKARGANCNSFIAEDDSFGPHGVSMRNAFIANTNPAHIQLLLHDAAGAAHSMPELCPNFKKFDGETRIRFWVWTMAAIAWEESTCKDNAINRRGTNDVAVGLLQLERSKSKRYWRGPLCNVLDVAKPNSNLNCGLEIMRGQFDGTYGKPAGLSMPNSYWQRLRAKWSKIDYLISLFPGCA